MDFARYMLVTRSETDASSGVPVSLTENPLDLNHAGQGFRQIGIPEGAGSCQGVCAGDVIGLSGVGRA